jgi:hypothetical protein
LVNSNLENLRRVLEGALAQGWEFLALGDLARTWEG